MPRKKRRHYPGLPGWLSAADVAKMRRISRSQAWRILRTLHAQHGTRDVYAAPRPDGRGKPAVIWRARTEVVMQYFEALDRGPDERIHELEGRVADLESEGEERDQRVDQLAADFQRLRDRLRV